MNHASPHLMEFTIDPIETNTIESKFTHQVKELSLDKGENRMHNKEQHQQAEYYKKLGDIIRNYKVVLLFGSTHAKVELFNTQRSDHHFEKATIDVKHADNMTENQRHASVKEYFSQHLSPITSGSYV